MNLFIARQPILDLQNQPFGYEFLYRDSADNRFRTDLDGSAATRKLISNLTSEFDLEDLTGGRYAFVNFTGELLRSAYVSYLEPQEIVVEILESVQPDLALLQRLETLKKQGFVLALDDYVGAQSPLTELADILKVDFRLTAPEAQQEIAARFAGKRLLAEKVETLEDLERAKACGYSLFQGYYFSKPVVIQKQAAEIATATYLRLWNEINKPDPSFDRLAQIIRTDVNLAYKFLARLNSMLYYRGNQVTNLKQALVYIGLNDLKRKTLLFLLRDVLGERQAEAAKQALTRAVFAERLAVRFNLSEQREDAYVAGLFSMIDTIVGRGLEDILDELYILPQVKAALLGEPGPLGDILQFLRCYETGDWDALEPFLRTYKVDRQLLSQYYLTSVEYAERAFSLQAWTKKGLPV